MPGEEEEAALALAIDHRPFQQGMNEVKASVAEGAEHIVEHMNRPRALMTEFHTVLRDITKDSPLLGFALEAGLSPIVGSLAAGIAVFKLVTDSLKEINKECDRMEEEAAKGPGNLAESFLKANEEALKLRREVKGFNEEFELKSEGTEAEGLDKQIAKLKEKHAENKDGFLEAKAQLLEQNEQMARTTAEAEKQRVAQLAILAGDTARLAKLNDINLQLKESEEHIKKLQAEKPLSKLGIEVRSQSDIQGDLMTEQVRRNRLEEVATRLKEEQLDITKSLRDAEHSATSHLETANRLEKERTQTLEERAALKRQHDREAFDDDSRMFDELKRQDEERAKLQRNVDETRERQKAALTDPYMPTLQQIANSAAWNRGDLAADRMQRQIDQMSMGTGFMAQHADQAQELLRLQDDARRAFAVEGPESARFKDDTKQIESLQRALRAAGLMKDDSKMDALNHHMADLLALAQKDGIKIQPINGK